MIKNSEELKKRIKEKLDKKADDFVDNLNMDDDEFTIDTMEDIMSRFNKESIIIRKKNKK